MARFLSATYHAEIKVAEFICDDGRHLLRCGGTLPWRLNNAGDLMSPVDTNGAPAPKKTRDYIGFAAVPNRSTGKTSHFFIFPDYAAGRRQMALSIKRLYVAKTLPELVEKYAPPGSNDTAKYTRDLLLETGVSRDATVGDLTDKEFEKVLDAIEKIEGYHNEAESRKEVWMPVSRITATDGARPVADEEIVLRLNGKDTAVKTNAYGQTPPIPHPNGQQVEALHKQANGELKSVGKIAGETGQHFSLLTWVERFFATPAPDKAPANANVSPRRAAMAYTVQPNDTLAKLAGRFNIPAAQIKRDNNLKNDKILAGKQLGIYGPLPATVSASAVKRAAPKATPHAKGHAAPPASKAAQTVRSKAATGKPIATVRAEQRMAPWMAVAFQEATTYAGKDEEEITKTHNYHRLVTDSDRKGGEVKVLKDKKGKPLLDKEGRERTRIRFDGFATLIGDTNAWCASFVNYCLKEAKYAPGRSHMSTFTFGTDKDLFVQVKEPIYGAIRFTHRTGGGHVCLVYGVAAGKLVVIGGNQGNQICFELMNLGDKGEAFFVPVPYKDYADKDGSVLPDVDVDALKKEFGNAVKISDEQIKAKKADKSSYT